MVKSKGTETKPLVPSLSLPQPNSTAGGTAGMVSPQSLLLLPPHSSPPLQRGYHPRAAAFQHRSALVCSFPGLQCGYCSTTCLSPALAQLFPGQSPALLPSSSLPGDLPPLLQGALPETPPALSQSPVGAAGSACWLPQEDPASNGAQCPQLWLRRYSCPHTTQSCRAPAQTPTSDLRWLPNGKAAFVIALKYYLNMKTHKDWSVMKMTHLHSFCHHDCI